MKLSNKLLLGFLVVILLSITVLLGTAKVYLKDKAEGRVSPAVETPTIPEAPEAPEVPAPQND